MFPRGVRIRLFNKHKKRRPLARPEFPTIFSDGGEWSTRHYSVKQLVRSDGCTFPLIVKVTRGYQDGYYDNDDAMISKNQVLRIHDSERQTRVEAVDSLGRNLSIPADFLLNVTPTDGHRAGDSLTLAEAAVTLPVKVVVLRTKSDGDDASDHVLTGQTLLLRKVTNDVFLRASAINKGWIDQSRVLPIPSFIGIEFTVADGIRGATSNEWTDYNDMFSRTVRHLNFDLVRGPPEIYVLDPSVSESDITESPYEELVFRATHEEQEDDEDSGEYEHPSNQNTWDSHVYSSIQSDHAYDDTNARVYLAIIED